MGLQNRDYFRSEYESSWNGGGSDYPVVKKLLIVTIAVFVLQILSTRNSTPQEHLAEVNKYAEQLRKENPNASDEEIKSYVQTLPPTRISLLQSFFELDSSKVSKGQIWRLLTYAFCHTRLDPTHILFNMLGLWWFGRTLEQMYGSREFLWFYLVSAFISGLAFVGLNLATGHEGAAVGASGSVLAIMCLFAWHFPTHIIRIFFVLPVEVRWVVILYAVYDFHPALLQLSGELRPDGIAHALTPADLSSASSMVVKAGGFRIALKAGTGALRGVGSRRSSAAVQSSPSIVRMI